jgi:hypothetical protein
MDRMKPSLLLIGVLVVAAFYYGYSRLITGVVEEVTKDNSKCLEMLGNTTTEVDGLTKITGSIRNNCDRKFLNVQVSFKVERTTLTGFDGPAFGNTNSNRSSNNNNSFTLPEPLVTASGHNLMPGGVWSFETFPIARGASYRLERMWGY